jgi:hypothetical protein
MFREEHRLRAFENRVLRSIFGPKRDEIARGEKRERVCLCVSERERDNYT